MNLFHEYISRILNQVSCDKTIKNECQEELLCHLEDLYNEYVQQGNSSDLAVQLAIDYFGPPKLIGKALNRSIYYYGKGENSMLLRKLTSASLTATFLTIFYGFLYGLGLSTIIFPAVLIYVFTFGVLFSLLIEFIVRRFNLKPRLIITFVLYFLSGFVLFAINIFNPSWKLTPSFSIQFFLFPTIFGAIVFFAFDELLKNTSILARKLAMILCIGSPVIIGVLIFAIAYLYK